MVECIGIHKVNNRKSFIRYFINDFCVSVYTDHNTIHYYKDMNEFISKWDIMYV